MIRSSARQQYKYKSYAIPCSFILLLQRLSLRISRTHKPPQNLETPNPKNKERELGKNLGPYKEHVVGNDPTGRNHGRVPDGGDPATNAGSVLERGRERGDVEEELRMGMGS